MNAARACRQWLAAVLLCGAALAPAWAQTSTATRLQALLAPTAQTAAQAANHLPAALLLGEQHDAAEHQKIEQEVTQWLVERGQLAALVLEMAEAGRSSAGLANSANDAQVRSALGWRDEAWPWAQYGPVVMAAVAAGVPVLGANLPFAEMRTAMQNLPLDGVLPGPALKAQQQAIRWGHCGLLPETQIAPVTRIQIARDQRMAQVLQSAALPGKVALLVAGSGHVDKQLGIPQHLAPGFKTKVVIAQAGRSPDSVASAGTEDARADAIWPTPALPEKDYCADLH